MQDDDNQGLILSIVFGLILLVIGLVIGLGLQRAGKQAPPAPGRAAPALGTGAVVVTPAVPGDGASVRVDNGVVKFYFASGSAALAAGARDALGEVVKGVAAGRRAVISGYHDATGDPVRNEELSKERAFAVRDALASLGIGADKLDLRKPVVSTAGGSNAEARRVEVTLE